MPAAFRTALKKVSAADMVIVTRSLSDPCLVVYSLEEWEKLEQRFAAAPSMDRDVRFAMRAYIGESQECRLDKQGRLQLRSELRDNADIAGEVVWNGLVKLAELWSKANYAECVEAPRKKLAAGEMPELAKKLADLGI